MTRHHAYTRVQRRPKRGPAPTPWSAHCEVCCCRIEVCEEALIPGMHVMTPPCSWWLPTRDEAQGVALAHLGQHREVAG